MHERRAGARGHQEGRRRLSGPAGRGRAAPLAAFAAGFGGLAAELAFLRHLALGIGNTAEAAALGTGAFVLGLGLGSAAAGSPRLRLASAPLYACVALGLVASEFALAALRGGSDLAFGTLGLGLVAFVAALMGAAFTRLFASGHVAWLVVPNLLGSGLAAAVAGNLLLPEYGPRGTLGFATLAYLVAAACARTPSAAPTPTTRRPSLALLRCAAAAGAATLAYEVLLFRRLPFRLEGFLPTLHGILVAVLVQLALGGLVAALLVRLAPHRRVFLARLLLLGGALAMLAPFGEGICALVADATRPLVTDTFTMHLRIWMVAAAAAVPLLPLGAVLPLLIAAEPEPSARPRWAGFLACAHGIGALAGAVLAAHLLPLAFPTAFFVAAPSLAALFAALGLRALAAGLVIVAGSLAAGLGSAGAGTLAAPAPPVAGSRFDHPERYRYLAHRTDAVTTASVIYDQGAYGLALFTDEFPAAYVAPTAGYMKALAHLPLALHGGVQDACVICVGTGTTLNALTLWPAVRRIDAVEISPAVLAHVDRFADDGPVATGKPAPFRSDARVRVHATDGRHFLARAPAGSYDVITMEPLLPYAPGTSMLYSEEFYGIARRALREGGLCVQWVPTHAMPAELFTSLLATFAAAFPDTSVWLFDRSTLLVGRVGAAGPEAALATRLAALSPDLRTSLHEASLATPEDFAVARLVDRIPAGFARGARTVSDGAPWIEALGYWSGREKLGFFAGNLAVLAGLVAAEARTEPIASLPRDRLQVAAVRRARIEAWQDPTRLFAYGDDPADAATGTPVALRALAPQSVFLWREERMIRESGGGAVRGDLRGGRVVGARGILEDLGRLPSGSELLLACRRGDPRALAYRTAFPARITLALVAALEKAPLPPADLETFAAIADPQGLRLAITAVRARGGSLAGEVLPLLRSDLALPPDLLALERGSVLDREDLAGALGERSDPESLRLLAGLLLDPEPGVRTAAGAALFRTAGPAIPYDPLGTEASRREAAQKLEALHNRRR